MSSNSVSFKTPVQKLQLQRIRQPGVILDIGGGGEGLVSRIEGSRVIAVDLNISKIRGAMIYEPDSIWITGDGRQLGFNDCTIDVVTLWFSLSYMKDVETKQTVVDESFRVLKPSGKISILGCHIDCEEERFVFRAEFALPDEFDSKISYAVNRGEGQSLDSISRLLERSGFEIIETESHEFWFKVIGSKPSA